MRIIITDTGNIWNANNPYLEQYKDVVLVVCLGGEKVTDKYECVVVPQKAVGLGMAQVSLSTLDSVAEYLNPEMNYHEDLVFLTDDVLSTLYPYAALRKVNEYNRFHLVMMPPLYYENKNNRQKYLDLLGDLSYLSSILYYDSNKKLKSFDQGKTVVDFYKWITDDLGKLLPNILHGINNRYVDSCFFDFGSMRYIPLDKGFDEIKIAKRMKEEIKEDYPIMRNFCTLDLISFREYPDEQEGTRETVERPVPRIDGKRICNILREQRIRLAAANNIPFSSEECPSIGPCAGTCEKCDREAKFLRKQLNKITKEQRVYPRFDPAEEVSI